MVQEQTCVANLLYIYNTPTISLLEKIILLLLFIIHWLILLFVSTYIYWCNKSYDWIILCFIIFLIITWGFTHNDCIISYHEKQILLKDNHIDINKMANPSLIFYSKDTIYTILLFTFLSGLCIYTITKVLLRNSFPKWPVYVFSIISILYLLKYRYDSIIQL